MIKVAQLNRKLLENELIRLKNSFIDIDPMCDAYKKEAANRSHNDIISNKINVVEYLLSIYDTITPEERESLRKVMRPHYLVTCRDDKHSKEYEVGVDNERVYIVKDVYSYKYRGWTKEKVYFTFREAKEKLEYVLDDEHTPVKRIAYDGMGHVNSVISEIRNKRKRDGK